MYLSCRHITAYFTCVLLSYPESATNLQVFLGSRVPACRDFQEADVEVLLECDVEQAIQLPDIYMCVRKLCESIPLVEPL